MTTDITSTDTDRTGADRPDADRLDIEAGAATGGPVEPDSQRVQQLHPRELLMDANVRHDARVDRAMVSSVRDHGVLQPIIAFATGGGRARVRFGHRRTLAAIADGHLTVPVIVHPSRVDADAASDEVERLSTQTVENTQREGLTVSEQLDAFAELEGLGLSAGQIASRTKTPRRDVVKGLRAARVAEVREAVASAGLTLEQAATLEEFSDDPDAYQALIERATNPRGYGPGFDHAAQRLRDDRAEAAAREALLAELTEAATPVIDQPAYNSGVKRLSDLTDEPEPVPEPGSEALVDLDAPEAGTGVLADDLDLEGESENGAEDEGEVDDWDVWDEDGEETDEVRSAPAPITPEAHAACPGHAAYVTTTYGGPKRGPQPVAVHVCTDPLGNGHRSRFGVPLVPSTASSAPVAGETAEQAEQRAAAQRAAKSAARKRVIAGNKAWDSATTVRREWLAELLTRKTPPKGACTWMAQAFVDDRYTVCRAAERGHATAADLLCAKPGTVGQADHDRITKALDGASENRATVITLGMILGAIEGETGRHQWRWTEQRFGRPDASLVRYLRALAGWNYTLSPIEHLAIGEDVDEAEVFDAPDVPAAGPTPDGSDGGGNDDHYDDQDAEEDDGENAAGKDSDR